jgi:hypothetical protein
MQKIGRIIEDKVKIKDTDKYVSREFQKYAYDLATELGDLLHTSMYMRIVKNTARGLVESARSFVKDATSVRSKPRLFLWKLKQLKESVKIKNANN